MSNSQVISLDLEKTYVVLIGSSTFPEDREYLRPIPQVNNNIRALAQIFADTRIIGVPKKNIEKIINKSKDEVEKRLYQVARQKAKSKKNTLIVYYAGHGIISDWKNGMLLLAVKNTTTKRPTSAIEFENFNYIVGLSLARKKILILDCCFSGKIMPFMGGGIENVLQGQIDISGSYVISAASADEVAKAPKGEKYTAFSAELINTLQEGIDNQKSGINLEELYTNIRSELNKKSMPEPQKANFQDADEIVIAFNQFCSKPLPPTPSSDDYSLNILFAIIFFLFGALFCFFGFRIFISSLLSNDGSDIWDLFWTVIFLFFGFQFLYDCWKVLRGEDL